MSLGGLQWAKPLWSLCLQLPLVVLLLKGKAEISFDHQNKICLPARESYNLQSDFRALLSVRVAGEAARRAWPFGQHFLAWRSVLRQDYWNVGFSMGKKTTAFNLE